MERPPSGQLRNIESCASSISSIDVTAHNPNYDAPSRRLVDYFVVFTSKPKVKKKKTKDDEDGQDRSNMDGGEGEFSDVAKKTPPRNFCCKKKSPKESSSRKVKQITSKKGGKKGKKHKRTSSGRSIHLVNNLLDDDETPIFSHRKRNLTNDNDDLFISDEEKSDLFPPSTVTGESLRLPVTAPSGSFASDSDIDTDDEDVVDKKTKQLNLNTKAKIDEDDGNNSKDEEDEEPLTPSRMRAIQGIDEDDTDDDVGNNKKDVSEVVEKRKKKIASKSRQSSNNSVGSGGSRGATENIHIPGEDNENEDSKNNMYLLPVETARYPLQDHSDNPLNPMITHFCFPQGEKIQLITDYIMPKIHYFVLTNDRGKKLYGTCLTVYEEFDLSENPEVDEDDLRPFYRNDDVCVETTDSESSIEVSLDYAEKCPQLYHPKVICILSSWPYLHAFREYLSQLYRLATMTNMMSCPIERYVLNICEEVPAPPPGMFEIRLQVRIFKVYLATMIFFNVCVNFVCHFRF